MVYLLRLKYVPDINGETGVLYDKFGTKKIPDVNTLMRKQNIREQKKNIAKLINWFTLFCSRKYPFPKQLLSANKDLIIRIVYPYA